MGHTERPDYSFEQPSIEETAQALGYLIEQNTLFLDKLGAAINELDLEEES